MAAQISASLSEKKIWRPQEYRRWSSFFGSFPQLQWIRIHYSCFIVGRNLSPQDFRFPSHYILSIAFSSKLFTTFNVPN